MAEVAQHDTRILLLEDSPLDAELATAKLERAGLRPQVTLVTDRSSYRQALEQGPYDVILADYALPDFDGLAALTLSRERMPHVPFIFISGRVGEEVAIDTLQRGATDYVLKQRLERLVPAVQRALREASEHATRMQAESMFRESEMRFRYVIDAVPQMVWIADRTGRLLYSNKKWKDYTDSISEVWCDPRILHPDDYANVTDAWARSLETQQPFTQEVRFRSHPEKNYRWHLLRVTPMEPEPDHSGAGELHWLGSATDLQEQKLNDEALRTADKLAVTGRMAAAIAHEINNPLESLTNLIFLVKMESQGNDRALTFLEMTETELSRISAITKQTLQFYRDPLVPVLVNISELVAEVMRLFSSRFRTKRITTTVNVQPDLVLEGIKGEVRQVLINLVNNAIDAVSISGEINVEAMPVMLGAEPGVQVSVYDNGSGIRDDQQNQLFQPFFSTKGAHGTGLGLWVSKGIVEKHGGTLRLFSTVADGSSRTTARLELPLRAVPELRQAADAPSA